MLGHTIVKGLGFEPNLEPGFRLLRAVRISEFRARVFMVFFRVLQVSGFRV